MSEAALEALIARQEALVAALDHGDVRALEAATASLREALAHVAAAGGWTARDELGPRLVQSLRLADAARGRVNYLADVTRRRLDRLATLGGAPRAQAYGRRGHYA